MSLLVYMSRKYWIKVEGLDSVKELEFSKETLSILNYLGPLMPWNT